MGQCSYLIFYFKNTESVPTYSGCYIFSLSNPRAETYLTKPSHMNHICTPPHNGPARTILMLDQLCAKTRTKHQTRGQIALWNRRLTVWSHVSAGHTIVAGTFIKKYPDTSYDPEAQATQHTTKHTTPQLNAFAQSRCTTCLSNLV